jgi:hypothetical protein
MKQEGGNHGRERGQPYQSSFQRGDEAQEDNDEQEFCNFFQSASEEVASTIFLAGRIGHMTESIEDEHKHAELFKDLQEHIHKNYVGAEREYSNI